MYAYLVVVLFYPFCCCADLMATTAGIQSHALRLHQLYEEDKQQKLMGRTPLIFTVSHIRFLQNIQDFRWNSSAEDDDLQECTHPFQRLDENGNPIFVENDDDEDKDQNDLEEHFFEDLLQYIGNPTASSNTGPYKPTKLSFKSIRDQSINYCGCKTKYQPPPVSPSDDPDNFVCQVNASNRNNNSASAVDEEPPRICPPVSKLYQWYYISHDATCVQSKLFRNEEFPCPMEANRPIRSIQSGKS
jgi:hypothetical protein